MRLMSGFEEIFIYTSICTCNVNIHICKCKLKQNSLNPHTRFNSIIKFQPVE